MYWNKILTTLFCGIFIYTVNGQNIFTGTLRDTLAQPIPFANIIAYLPDKDSTILAFTQSNTEGKFSISVSDTNAILQFAFIGYEAVHIPVKTFQNGSTVILKPKIFVVQVTEIVDKPPIKQIGDTLVFNADAYRQGNERTVEDLIKKVPGFEVKNDGKISFGGKPVQEVLIEGDKIGQKGYENITQKLNAKVVEDIYVIPDYENNPLLADINENAKLALNLTLKEAYRNHWLGSIQANGGTPQRYAGDANITGLRKKTKLILDGNYNNVPIFPAKNSFYPQDEAHSGLVMQPKEVFQLYPKSMAIPEIMYQKNKSGSGGVMLTQRFKRSCILNFSTDYHDVQQSYFQTLFQTFFLTNYPVFVQGLQLFKQDKKEFYTGAKFTYLPLSLKNRIVYEGYFSQSSIQSMNGMLGLTSILQNEMYRNKYHHHALEYDYKIKNGHVLLSKFRYQNIDNRSQYRLLPLFSNGLYIPATNIPTSSLYQNYRLPVQNYSAEVNYVQKKYILSTAYLSEQQQLFTHIDTLSDIKNDWKYSNNMVYRWQAAYIEVKSKLYQNQKEKKKKLQANARMMYGHFAYKKDTALSLQVRQKIWLLPELLWSMVVFKKLPLIFSYQYKVNVPQIQDFQHAYTFSDFRTLKKGTSDWFPNPVHAFSLNSMYVNLKKGLVVFSLLSYAYNQGRFNTLLTVDSLYTFSSITDKPSHSQMAMAYFNIGKSLVSIQHRLKFKTSLVSIITPAEFGEFEVKNTMHNFQPSVGISSVFTKWFNYEFNIDYRLNQNRMQLFNQTFVLVVNNHTLQPNLSLIFRYKTLLSATYQHYFTQQYAGTRLVQSFHWANTTLNYTPKKFPRWQFGIKAYNLYGLKSLTETYAGNNQQTIQTIQLQPRIILGEVNVYFN